MPTNNADNFALGLTGQVLTMISATAMAFQNASNRSQTAPTRTLNTIFQASATRDVLAIYSVDVSTSLSLTGGSQGSVVLEIASDAAFTLNVQTVGMFTNANTGTLTIGLALNQTVTANLAGYIPMAYYVRLRTVTTTGTPTFAYKSGQEVLL